MAKLTSQNSSKSKVANLKTAAEEKKPKSVGRKSALAAKRIAQLVTKDKVRTQTSQELHIPS